MRDGSITRKTAETDIAVKVRLDGTGSSAIATGVGFFDHMLELFARHSLIDLEVSAKGDTHVDFHHTVEDVGIALGGAILQAWATRRASRATPASTAHGRNADARCGRRVGPALPRLPTSFPTPKIGEFDTELVREFFQPFAMNAGLTLHVETLYGVNSHHIAESCFKGWRGCCAPPSRRSARGRARSLHQGRALREAAHGFLCGADPASGREGRA